jgi:hypothetical protein
MKLSPIFDCYYMPIALQRLSEDSPAVSFMWPGVFTQAELLESDEAQWTKIARLPEYARRRTALAAAVRQLAFDFPLMRWLFLWL